MTEQEWLTNEDPSPMLDFLRGPAVLEVREMHGRQIPFEVYPERRGSERKLRLLGVACCRRHWHLFDVEHCRKLAEVGDQMSESFTPSGLPLDSCQRAVELAELAADEPIDAKALSAAADAADMFHHPSSDYAACYVEDWGPYDSELMASGNMSQAVSHACRWDFEFHSAGAVLSRIRQALRYLNENGDSEERAAQTRLVRDIFGNPFRPVALDREWLTSTVVALARDIYEKRAFDQVPILADALQDAGCDNADVLAHCRGDGSHVRGCWVVDMILAKS